MKTLKINLLTGFTVALIGTGAFASGFRCNGDMGYSVKLFNYTVGETRTPAVMIISQDDEGTLLRRTGSEIRKHNRTNTIQYVVEGSRKLDSDTAILQISFREGREVLEEGETADGQLILIKDGDRGVFGLVCERYLKAN